MGERVLFQVVRGEDFSPVIYCHWAGDQVRQICTRLRDRMGDRCGDLHYTAARLVQECIDGNEGNLSFGIWNATSILTAADSHGDGGVVLIDVSGPLDASGPQMQFKCFGGYWVTVENDLPKLKWHVEGEAA